MNGQHIIKLFYTGAIIILPDVYACSPYYIAVALIPINTARKDARLSTVSVGPADSPKEQRNAVALAEARQLILAYLEKVNKHAKKLNTRGAAWKLRAELSAYEGTFEEVEAYAKKRVTEQGGDTKMKQGVRLGRVVTGMSTISITDTQSSHYDYDMTHEFVI